MLIHQDCNLSASKQQWKSCHKYKKYKMELLECIILGGHIIIMGLLMFKHFIHGALTLKCQTYSLVEHVHQHRHGLVYSSRNCEDKIYQIDKFFVVNWDKIKK
jgi:hypothetical protein